MADPQTHNFHYCDRARLAFLRALRLGRPQSTKIQQQQQKRRAWRESNPRLPLYANVSPRPLPPPSSVCSSRLVGIAHQAKQTDFTTTKTVPNPYVRMRPFSNAARVLRPPIFAASGRLSAQIPYVSASEFAYAPRLADASTNNPTRRCSVSCLALALARALGTAGGRRRARAIACHAILMRRRSCHRAERMERRERTRDRTRGRGGGGGGFCARPFC